MEGAITQNQTVKNKELDKKLAELAALEVELAERELELATLRAELHTFEREYLRIIGSRYVTLDEIEAEIAKYLAFLNPADIKIFQQAEKAWNRAQETKYAAGKENIADSEPSKDFKPWDSLKKLYREAAKCIHPDLTTNENERCHRQKLMAEVNLAYESGDEVRLQAILEEWQNYHESARRDEITARILHITQKITQVRERLRVIHREIQGVKQSELYQLKEKQTAFNQKGQNFLLEIGVELDKQIATAKRRLKKLKIKMDSQV